MFWQHVSKILGGSRKARVLRALMPGELDQRSITRLCRLDRADAYRTLKELCDDGLVECLTPERQRARIYRITGQGAQVLDRSTGVARS